MAQNLYCGLQRSGKSYEVVSNVILPAIEQGRDVISNIAGLNQSAMYELLMSEGKDSSKFGRLVTVTEEQIMRESFWLTDRDKTQDQKDKKFIKAGMLVALDEIWRFFPSEEKVPYYVMNFFRMHGHFVNQTNGLTCEIALICQHPDDLHRSLKRTVMSTYMMEKATNLGLDKQYTIKVYNKTRITSKALNTFGPYTYNKKYFPLYTSNSINESGIKPREVRTEKRNSIFASKFFRLAIPLAVFMFIGGIWQATKFFNPEESGLVPHAANNSISPTKSTSQQVQTNGIPVTQNPAIQSQQVTSQPSWRVAGLFGIFPNEKALLVNEAGHSRIVIAKTVSRYAEIISITTYPKDQTYDNQPFSQTTGLIK